MYLDLIGHRFIPLRDRLGNIRAYTVVDEQDAHLSAYRWRLHRGYAQRHDSTRRGRTVFLHRQVMRLAVGDTRPLDHINRNPLDNRRGNLRIVTPTQNGQNLKPRAGGTSQYRGVSKSDPSGRWIARARVDGVSHYIGSFVTETDASTAASEFRAKHMSHSDEGQS